MFYVLSAIVYTAGALWVTRPLVAHLAEAIPIGTTPHPGNLAFLTGDAHQLLFYAWLFVRNLRAGAPAFANTIELAPFNPGGMHPMGSWGFPLQPSWWALTSLGLSASAAYDVVVLASYPLTGLSTAFCLRRLGASRLASFIGGTVYAFCVFRHVQLVAGHANGFLLWLFPWLYLGLAEWRRGSGSVTQVGYGLLTGVVLFAMALGEWHLFYYASLFVAVMVLAWVVQRRHDGVRAVLARLVTLAPAGIIALTGFAWVRAAQKHGLDVSAIATGRDTHEAVRFTLLPFDLFVPWVRFARDVVLSHDLERRSSYVGLTILAVIGLAIARRRQSRAVPLDDERLTFVWMVIIALLLAFSPVLTPLYVVLKSLVPYWGFVRVKGRLLFIVMFALAGLAAWAVDRLRTTGDRRWQWPFVAAVLADLVLVSPSALLSRGPHQWSAVLDTAARLDDAAPLLVIPITAPDDAASSAAQRLAMLVDKPMLNGYEPVAAPAAFATTAALAPLDNGNVTTEARAILDRYNTHYVLHDRDVTYGKQHARQSTATRDALLASGYFHVLVEDAHYSLLAYDRERCKDAMGPNCLQRHSASRDR